MLLSSALIELILPPTGLACLGLLALLIPRAFRLVPGRPLALLLLLLLVALSTPLVGQALLHSLETTTEVTADPQAAAATDPPGAIVVLSGDATATATPPFLEVGALTLERERAGAALHRATGLPLLVTGGQLGTGPALAAMMAGSLQADFGVPVRWQELRSQTTWENARFSAPILKDAGIHRVYLVTHAWHMRRSLLAFRRAGIDAVAAPVRLDPPPRITLTTLMPRVSGWTNSYFGIHEWIGLLYYAWRR